MSTMVRTRLVKRSAGIAMGWSVPVTLGLSAFLACNAELSPPTEAPANAGVPENTTVSRGRLVLDVNGHQQELYNLEVDHVRKRQHDTGTIIDLGFRGDTNAEGEYARGDFTLLQLPSSVSVPLVLPNAFETGRRLPTFAVTLTRAWEGGFEAHYGLVATSGSVEIRTFDLTDDYLKIEADISIDAAIEEDNHVLVSTTTSATGTLSYEGPLPYVAPGSQFGVRGKTER